MAIFLCELFFVSIKVPLSIFTPPPSTHTHTPWNNLSVCQNFFVIQLMFISYDIIM